MVPGQAVTFRWTMLDERLHGDDDFVGYRSSSTLRLGNKQVPTSHGDYSCFSWNDVE